MEISSINKSKQTRKITRNLKRAKRRIWESIQGRTGVGKCSNYIIISKIN